MKGECDEQDDGNGNDEQEKEEKRAYDDDNEVQKMEESRNNINLFESELKVKDVCPD